MDKQKFYYSPQDFSGFADGKFFSPVFDSGKEKTEWDRLKLEINSGDIELKVYIFDGENHTNEPIVTKFCDILLYRNKTCGRYLQFEVEYKGESNTCDFTAYELSFPKMSFVKYLPVIYQENETLERFLAVFQNQYLDNEREIMNFYRELNVRTSRMLPELAELINGEMFLGLEETKLRKLLEICALLYRIKGTKNCLVILIKVLTGEKPHIIDCAEELSESERKTYGSEKGRFYIILKTRPKDIDLDLLNYIIKQFIPVICKYTMIFLDENSNIGSFVFLNENSEISEKKQPVIGSAFLGKDLRI